MGTLVTGEKDVLLASLEASFQSVATHGDPAMVVSLSNCCPAPAGDANRS
jgi:hypothetical protein